MQDVLRLGGIASLVFLDLEFQEIMNGGLGFRIFTGDLNDSTGFGLFELVLNIHLQPFHGVGAGRIL